jgi:excisionase family DNA binding protein
MEPLSLTLPDELIEQIAGRVVSLIREGAVSEEPGGLHSAEGRVVRPYLSVIEAAEYLRAKPQRVYDLLSSGRLTRFKDGRRVLVSRQELEAYLDANRLSRVAPALPPFRRPACSDGFRREAATAHSLVTTLAPDKAHSYPRERQRNAPAAL